MRSIRLSLIENAESFLNEPLAKAILAKEDPREWKFAILALVQALELTLKEMLRREHWTLVFQSVDKPTMTVSFEGALSRLTNIVKVPFAADDIATARTATALRNQVTHSDVHFEEQQVKVVFTRLLGFAQHCFAIYLGKPLQEVVSRPVWDEAILLFEFTEELCRRATERLESEGLLQSHLLDCPRCQSSDVVVLQGKEGTCYVCGHKEEITRCATCGDPEFSDEAWLISDNCAAFCCDKCLEIGVLVLSPTRVSRLDQWEEVKDDSSNVVLSRRSNASLDVPLPNPPVQPTGSAGG
jgi:hypothetical protein